MGISREQALDCFRSDDLVGIGMEADAVRRRLHPEGVVSYAIEQRIDCTARLELVCRAVDEAVEAGASGVRLVGGIEGGGIAEVLRHLRRRFPAVWIEGLSAAEVLATAAAWGVDLSETIARLRDAGLDSIAGEGVGLVGGERNVAKWIEVHRAAHGLGMRTEAGMVFGAGETSEQRVDLLEAMRALQEETGGFAAFVPEAAAAPGDRELDGVTAVERLKTLAIARMYLENIENVQASATAQGLKVLQVGLRFGANDVGPVRAENGSEEDVRRIIRDAGFQPAQRDMAYAAMMVN